MSELAILIIDDDEMLCRALRRMLRPNDVTIANSASGAVKVLAGTSSSPGAAAFDVILCDVMMPDVSGPELYHRLEPEQQRRVLMMTGGMLQRIRPMLESVPRPLIEKPFTRTELQAAVAHIVAENRDTPPCGQTP